MLPILLLALAVGQPLNNVTLDDLKRFEITDAQLRDRIKLVVEYRQFYDESLLRNEGEYMSKMKSARSGSKADARRRPT